MCATTVTSAEQAFVCSRKWNNMSCLIASLVPQMSRWGVDEEGRRRTQHCQLDQWLNWTLPFLLALRVSQLLRVPLCRHKCNLCKWLWTLQLQFSKTANQTPRLQHIWCNRNRAGNMFVRISRVTSQFLARQGTRITWKRWRQYRLLSANLTPACKRRDWTCHYLIDSPGVLCDCSSTD